MIIFLLACGNNNSTSTEDNQQNTDLFKDVEFIIRWEESAIVPEVNGGDAGSWWFGLAERGAQVLEPWTGEDCFEGDQWESDAFTYCHPILAAGTELTFTDSPLELIPGEQTFISSSQNPERMMYYFLDALSGTCFIDGGGLDAYLELCSNQFEMTILY